MAVTHANVKMVLVVVVEVQMVASIWMSVRLSIIHVRDMLFVLMTTVYMSVNVLMDILAMGLNAMILTSVSLGFTVVPYKVTVSIMKGASYVNAMMDLKKPPMLMTSAKKVIGFLTVILGHLRLFQFKKFCRIVCRKLY